ncbi:MAG: IS200/IS605 family element transposase accessory protein TnpB [Geobacter sp.]|nr:IS200/IS605 family element transposase accessory protein TnpB [Geobacter sp.]
MSNKVATYQGRLDLDEVQSEFFDGYARHYNHVERCLYADMRRYGKAATSFKNEYLIRHSVTARQFNAIARNLEGKIASTREQLPLQKDEVESRIARAKKVISKSKSPLVVHQKKRRLHILRTRLGQIEQQIESGDPSICFGSRRLFRAQFNLRENGYAHHGDWKRDWESKRSSQFYVLGSKDETSGCQGCVISANLDGSFNLRLRSLSKEAQYVELRNIRIPYGQDVIRQAMRNPQAISYRFLRDDKGWRVFITTSLPEIKTRSIKTSGAIGVDINADCLAISESDRFGNLIGTEIIPLVTYGKDTNQAKALIGEAVKRVIEQASAVSKPIVIEKLNFSKKKAALEKEDPRHARMLSSLSYGAITEGINARAYRHGIEVIEVNPAYSSIIGLVTYAQKKGISVHQAASLVIARRGCGLRERPVKGEATIPTPKGDHVTFALPARNRAKHVWSFWSDVKKIHTAVLAAHFRPPQGEPLARRSKSKSPIFTVRLRNANRQQHCSADVMGDIPW